MRYESGRSLIELLGVLAIGAAMAAGAIAMYTSVRATQVRTIANAELEQVVKNTKLLMEMRGDYTGLSVEYLIKAGALKNNTSPLGEDKWSVEPTLDARGFEIKLYGLSFQECAYFTTAIPTWTSKIIVNGASENPGAGCFSSDTNQLTFVIE